MLQLIKAGVISSLLLLGGCAEKHSGTGPLIVINNATLIDGINNAAATSQSVLIEGDVISDVFATGSKSVPKHATIIELSGGTLLPGLINGHVHLTPNPKKQNALDAMLHHGITTVRDLGGNGKLLGALNQSGGPTPTLAVSATFFGPKFMQDPRVARASAPFPPGQAPWMRVIDPETDIETVIADAKTAGANGLKLYASLDPKSIAAITSEAHEQGLKVWAHSVIFPSGPSDIVAAGVDQIVHAKGLAALGQDTIPDSFAEGIREWTPHLNFDDIDPLSENFQNLFSAMVKNKTVLEPALIADGDVTMAKRPLTEWQSAQRDWACRATKAAYDAGVVISAGTDFFGETALLFLELERLVDCGLTPMDAIKAATVNNADVMGIEDQLGVIAIGMKADLLAVSGDPLTSIASLRNTQLVIKNGVIVRNDLTLKTEFE